ncbi:MAG: PD40 domain-containing protein [Rhizobacter sp.]|nr:PD40 domain-containing protein [Rhizobacter sp.]
MRTLIALMLFALLAGCGGKSDDPPVTTSCPTGGFSNITPLASNKVVFDSDRNGVTHEIYVMNADGSSVVRLTNDAAYQNWWPRISPDRRKILFYRAPLANPESYQHASLWVMNADGTDITQLRAQGENGWTAQGHAEWSPDGSKIAMFGSVGPALEIFVTNACGKNPVQYTSRGGVNTDVSWSPNGQQLLFNGCASATVCQPVNYEIYVMAATPLAAGTRITIDTRADYDAYFSPDGTKLAWLINVDPTANVIPGTATALGRWAIGMVDVSVGGVLSNPRYLIDDGNINSKPAWSLDSQTIFFHRMVPADGYRFRVFSISANGIGLTELTPGATGNSEHPSN